MDRHIYEIYGSDPINMTISLIEKANIAAEIPSGASIALKPNLVVSKDPSFGATTHAGILEGTIRYLKDYGFKNISIIESAWVGDRTERSFRACAYNEIAQKYNVPFFDLKKDKTRTVQTRIGPMDICVRALDVDYLISLPVLKGHCQTAMTCCLKIIKAVYLITKSGAFIPLDYMGRLLPLRQNYGLLYT